MIYRLSSLFLLLPLVLFGGCGGVKKPKGFPDLVRPVTVKVLKEGQPLNNIKVVLLPREQELNFRVAGDTNANGVATIQTSRNTYSQSGVPVGKYVVQLVESIAVTDMRPFPENDAAIAAWTREYDAKLAAIRTIPAILASETDSPLEIEILKSPVTLEIDVAKY